MQFKKLPSNSRKLLNELLATDNPVELLCRKIEQSSSSEKDELCGILRELREEGYIHVKWASNLPYIVTIHNKARTYEERLAEYESELAASKTTYIYHDHSVRIGDGNKINKSVIGSDVDISNPPEKKSFWNDHPLLVGIVGAVIAGVILMFSFWESIVAFIEGLL